MQHRVMVMSRGQAYLQWLVPLSWHPLEHLHTALQQTIFTSESCVNLHYM